MKRHALLMLKTLLFLIAINFSQVVLALKIDNNHYRYCVMDDASITDADAASADRAGRLPFFPNAYWYSYNGVMFNGTQDYLKNSNAVTSIKVLMKETYSGSNYSIRHQWGIGMGSYIQDKTTYIYISVDAPTGVAFKNVPTTMLVGDEKKIATTLLGSFTSFTGNGYFDYSYSSSDSEVLTVSSGKISAKKKGKVRINVKAYAKNRNYTGSYYIGSATQEIEVLDDLSPKSISIEPTTLDLYIGQETTLNTILTPKEAETKITWQSTDKDVISVDEGRIKAIGKGKAKVIAKTSNGLSATCEVTVSVAPEMSISDINCSWGSPREQVISNQIGGYYIVRQNDENVVFTKTTERLDEIYLAYKFDRDGKLCASTLSMPENNETKRLSDGIFAQYDSDITVEDGLEVKIDNENVIAVDISSANNGGNIITLGFSYFEPLEERDDCIDLGLSVRWATTNLGASKPTGIGGFYAFSETSTKSEYWRENYRYCNNNSNQYVFVYTNPQANICGSNYDVVSKQLGEGWRMPSLAEANELITKCSWEKVNIDGVDVVKVTGPNGNHIILPIVSWKKQNKDNNNWQLHLGIGECLSKTSESTYIITFKNSEKKGSVSQEWKAWGYNIRPVYTK